MKVFSMSVTVCVDSHPVCYDREAFWECVWAQTAANGFSSSQRHVWPLWNPVCVREPGPVDLIDGIHTFTGEK